MTETPIWFERTRWYFHNNHPEAIETIEQATPPRTRIETRDGLPQNAIDNLPEHLTVITDNPTESTVVLVKYNDDNFGTETDLEDLLD